MMNIIDIKESYSDRLMQLRERLKTVRDKDSKEIIERGFYVPKTLHKNRLLFIGMNPSFTDQKQSNNHLINYYTQPSDEPEQYKRYYNPLRDLARKVNMEWTHWDLFYLQETKQHRVKKFDKQLDEQFELSFEIIKKAEPIIIVVNNAHASNLIYNKMGTPQLDNQIGTYIFQLTTKASAPIFFCSMLSGQRAMDTHSKERLAWHISFILKKI